MSKLFHFLKTDFFLFVLVAFLIIFFQFNLISHDSILDYDDKSLLGPIYDGIFPWTSGYLKQIQAGKILDFQPVRDLTYSFDVLIKKHFGIGIHHLHNCVVWIITGIFFYKILSTLQIPRSTSIIFYFLFSFNPVLWNSICWISARKHLLSSFFTIWATYILLGFASKQKASPKLIVTVIILYLLACLSQPINIGWPLFALIFFIHGDYLSINFKKIKILFLSLFIISGIVLCANFYYYWSIYPKFSITPKFLNHSESEISFRILSLGRHYFQSLIPFWPTPTPYYLGDIKNIIGIVVFVVFFYFFLKQKNKKIYYPWLLLSILPLIVVTLKMTNIFGYDTYLITTIFSCYICIALFCSKLKIEKIKLLYLPLISLLISFMIISKRIPLAFENSKKLFTFAYNQEATPFNLRSLAKYYIDDQDYDGAVDLALRLIDWDPYQANVDEIFSKIIYFANKLSRNSKIELFEEKIRNYPDLVWAKYLLSCLELEEGNFQQSFNLIQSINPDYYGDFGSALPKIAAHLVKICHEADANCETILRNISTARKFHLWNEFDFNQQLKLYQLNQ